MTNQLDKEKIKQALTELSDYYFDAAELTRIGLQIADYDPNAGAIMASMMPKMEKERSIASKADELLRLMA